MSAGWGRMFAGSVLKACRDEGQLSFHLQACSRLPRGLSSSTHLPAPCSPPYHPHSETNLLPPLPPMRPTETKVLGQLAEISDDDVCEELEQLQSADLAAVSVNTACEV